MSGTDSVVAGGVGDVGDVSVRSEHDKRSAGATGNVQTGGSWC